MTQQELIWVKLALLAELRQNTNFGIAGKDNAESLYFTVFNSVWDDIRAAKVEGPVPNATECPCSTPEQATGCVPEVVEGDPWDGSSRHD